MINRIRLFASLLAATVWIGACGNPQPQREPQQRPVIVFMSDFGTANDAVAICRAVIYAIAPNVRLTDITHQVTPFSIEEGARFLAGVSPYYPAGTVFLAVIDPGVGTSRKAVIVKTKKGQYFVLPDNGLITPVLDRDALDSAREITNSAWILQSAVSSTFHGRDIFSPAAAHLAAGWDFALAGPTVSELVRLKTKAAVVTDKRIDGDVIGLDDPFGSLITDIPAEEFQKLGYNLGDKVVVQIDRKPVMLPYVRTFMDVPVGDTLLYVDSRGRMAVAVNQGNYSRRFNIIPPVPVSIAKKGAPIKGR